MFLYDYEKTLFIVDSMTAAFMISIMTNNRPAKVIFEHKREIMNEDSFEKIKAFSYKAIRIISAQEYSVPHPFFFFENGFLKAMDNLRKFSFDMRKSGFREDDSIVYVGSTVSSIISSLNCEHNHIIYLYHGVGDYLRDTHIHGAFFQSKLWLKSLLYDTIFSKYTNLNKWPWELGLNLCNIYSMCNNTNLDSINWVDCSKFQSEQIKAILDATFKQKNFNQMCLFFPFIEAIKQDGINKNTAKYDDINIQIIKKHVHRDKMICIKYHPSLYRVKSGGEIRISLIDKLKNMGYKVIDIASMIPNEIGGAMIPAEVLLKYLNFELVITYDSSTMWHLQKYKKIRKIIDLQELPVDVKSRLKKINDCMKTVYKNDIVFYE